jgi:hypothetical protein
MTESHRRPLRIATRLAFGIVLSWVSYSFTHRLLERLGGGSEEFDQFSESRAYIRYSVAFAGKVQLA